MSELTARRNQAFAGATSLPYPLLDQAYVRHVLQRLAADGMALLPSEGAAWTAFQALGDRPEEFLRALAQLRASAGGDLGPDQLLPVIATTLRGASADLELLKVEQIGGLASAVFDRVAASEGPVRVEEIQPVVNELLGANVLMRLGHGLYGITDPVVQEIWRPRRGQG